MNERSETEFLVYVQEYAEWVGRRYRLQLITPLIDGQLLGTKDRGLAFQVVLPGAALQNPDVVNCRARSC
jgi:hypothetical protein